MKSDDSHSKSKFIDAKRLICSPKTFCVPESVIMVMKPNDLREY